MNWESAWEGPAASTETGDAAVVARARRGDREAFGELVEALWSELVALARAILASDLDAEDLVQETLVHAWSRLGELRDDGRFAAWVRRSLVRRCFRRGRAARRERDAGAEPDGAVAPSTDPTARLSVERALAVLSPRQRAVVYLTAVEGRSDREIGSMLGLFPPTVRVHRMRAMRNLRRHFGELR